MLIKIIKGSYGYRIGGKVTPKTYKDEPFEVPKEQADRLVKKGIAEIIKSAEAEKIPNTPAVNKPILGNKSDKAKTSGEKNKVPASKKSSAAVKQQEDTDGETPPQLDPVPPVE